MISVYEVNPQAAAICLAQLRWVGSSTHAVMVARPEVVTVVLTGRMTLLYGSDTPAFGYELPFTVSPGAGGVTRGQIPVLEATSPVIAIVAPPEQSTESPEFECPVLESAKMVYFLWL